MAGEVTNYPSITVRDRSLQVGYIAVKKTEISLARPVAGGFCQRDAVCFENFRRRDHVHIVHDRAKRTSDSCCCQRLGVQLRWLTFKTDLNVSETAISDLASKQAELFSEVCIWLQPRGFFSRDAWRK